MLIVYLPVLILFKQYADSLVKYILPIFQRLLLLYSNAENKKGELQSKLTALLDEQKELNMLDEFAKYSKLQRKVDHLKDEIKKLLNEISSRHLFIRSIMSWLVHILISILLLYQVYMHRYDPVLQVPSKLLYPHFLAKLVAFPTGIPGNIGCIFWLFVCRFTFSTCSKHLSK